MKCLIVGFGNLGKAIIDILPTKEKIYVFSRTKEKVVQYKGKDPRISWIDPKEFVREKEVWLMLPAEEIPKFIAKYIHCFHQEATFYYCATKGMSSEMEVFVLPTQSVIPVKFIIQTDQLIKDKKGMAAIPSEKKNYKKRLNEWFGESMEIVIGEEKEILKLNKTATEMAIGLVMDLQEEMEKHGIPSYLVNHAAKQIVPGVIQSFLNNTLGGFGKQVMEERGKKGES